MSKKIKASAFHFGKCSFENGITSQNFWDWLIEKSGRTGWPLSGISDDESSRQFFCAQTSTDFFGLLVTPDEKVHHVVDQDSEGHSIVRPHTNARGQPSVQINFFVIRKDFLTGLYAHYRGSYPFTKFLATLWNAYFQFCSQMVHGEVAGRRYNTHPIFSDVAFKQAVSELSAVKEIHVSSPSLLMPDDTPIPANASIKGTRHTIRLGGGTGRTYLNMILWLRGKSQVGNKRKGFVCGYHADDTDRLIQIDFENTKDDFLSAVYEEIGEIDITSLDQHSMISDMQRTIHDNELFNRSYDR
jgi:hypothetical protein